jgi:pyrimidine operon attenuation protein/uracil phosphoribosyltransferase
MTQLILDHSQIVQKIKRIAFQIYETNASQTEVIIAGINGRGFELAKLLKLQLDLISPMKTVLCEVYIDKKNVQKSITTSLDTEDYKEKSLVLVDDVLNSGTTLIYCVKHFLNVPLKQFKTAVLVNRNHKKYPVKADFKGISLSTSINEHISVELDSNNFKAYLT